MDKALYLSISGSWFVCLSKGGGEIGTWGNSN